jgi:chromosome segregation ATPase
MVVSCRYDGSSTAQMNEAHWTTITAVVGACGTLWMFLTAVTNYMSGKTKARTDDNAELGHRLTTLMARTADLEKQRDADLLEKSKLGSEKLKLLTHMQELRDESEHLRSNMVIMSKEIETLRRSNADLSLKLDEALAANKDLMVNLRNKICHNFDKCPVRLSESGSLDRPSGPMRLES